MASLVLVSTQYKTPASRLLGMFCMLFKRQYACVRISYSSGVHGCVYVCVTAYRGEGASYAYSAHTCMS